MTDLLMDRPRRFVPRYVRAHRSHCWFIRNWHLHAWRNQPCSLGKQSGLTLKHRRAATWRHWSLRKMRYASCEKGCGQVRHFEFVWHDSANARGDRVRGSKRYLRFKVCL